MAYLDPAEPDYEEGHEEAVVDDGEEAEVDGGTLAREVGCAHVHEEGGRVADNADDDDDGRDVFVDASDDGMEDDVSGAVKGMTCHVR